MIDTVQFGRQVPMFHSSLLSPSSTTNTETVTFIIHVHRNRSSPFYDTLVWTRESTPTIVRMLWAGWQRFLCIAMGGLLNFHLLHNIQNKP